MGKIFNVSGDCKPGLHYMVDIQERLCKIKELIDRGEYFTINRARQYGKTTTLRALKRYLGEKYLAVSLDFQRLDAAMFGFITVKNGNISVSNRIFETRLYNGFLAEEAGKLEISKAAAEVHGKLLLWIFEKEAAACGNCA